MRMTWLFLFCLTPLWAQVKSRELEDLFTTDSRKPKVAPKTQSQPPATIPTPPKKTGVGVPVGHDPERHLLRHAGVKCRVQLVTAESVKEVDPSTTFHSGDRIRLLLEPNIDGYLYILQTGSSGKESVLFPHASINGGRNEVMRGRLYSIPSEGLFRFDNRAGEEKLKVILSRTPLESLPSEAPVAKPGVQMAMNMNLVNTELNRQVLARDLVYVAEEGPAAKDAPRGPTQAVIWVNKGHEQNNLVFFDLRLKHE